VGVFLFRRDGKEINAMNRGICALVYSNESAASKRVGTYIKGLNYDLARLTGMSVICIDHARVKQRFIREGFSVVPTLVVSYLDEPRPRRLEGDDIYRWIDAITTTVRAAAVVASGNAARRRRATELRMYDEHQRDQVANRPIEDDDGGRGDDDGYGPPPPRTPLQYEDDSRADGRRSSAPQQQRGGGGPPPRSAPVGYNYGAAMGGGSYGPPPTAQRGSGDNYADARSPKDPSDYRSYGPPIPPQAPPTARDAASSSLMSAAMAMREQRARDEPRTAVEYARQP
jgi:hypothetical protein